MTAEVPLECEYLQGYQQHVVTSMPDKGLMLVCLMEQRGAQAGPVKQICSAEARLYCVSIDMILNMSVLPSCQRPIE